MAKEEQVHVTYLKARKKEWAEKGKLNLAPVETFTPTRERIDEGLAQLQHKLHDYDWKLELDLLRKARQMESETGAFYKRMVREMAEDGAALFSGFLAIEDAHYDLVQSQIEALEGGGFWYDTQEFSLEGG
jgi:rubrerythrin